MGIMDQKLLPRIILPKAELASASESPTLDPMPAGSELASKRRCISSACMPCRRRKSKCDGQHPACNACSTVYGSPCYYDIDSDHRRKGALKRDIAQLRGEIDSHNAILDAIRKGSESDVDDIIQLVRANPDESYESVAASIQRMSLAKNKSELEGELTEFEVKPALATTGANRHYGHTSNLALLGSEEDQPSVLGDQLGSWTNVTNDDKLIQHLFDVYFTWSHPFYLLFSEEAFYYGLQDRKLKYCTPLLVNAVLALACHHSDRIEARADPEGSITLADKFFAEAKRLLYEDDRSCLTTVSALGLMSIRQAITNKDSHGWQYAGQMMSMTVQLGLHLSAQQNGKMTATETEARRVTFWGVLDLETVWALCLGRISWLPRAAISLEMPCVQPHLEERLWKPHGLQKRDADLAGLQQPGLKYTVLIHNSMLSEIVNDIVHMFYAPKDRITSRKLQVHHERLQAWHDKLPESLRIKESGPTLPQVFTLHIFYHNCVIHLFRPFLKVSFVQNLKPPRQICTEHANAISRLTNHYSQTYGLQNSVLMMLHCIMSAAVIHLVNVTSTPGINSAGKEQSETYLIDAIRGLHQMQQSYPITERYTKAIKSLVHKWCSSIPPRVQEVLSSVEMPSPHTAHKDVQTDKAHFASNGGNSSNQPLFPRQNPRKDSAPDLVRMAPPPHMDISNFNNGTTAPSYQQQLFWTPFPDASAGVPLAVNGRANVSQGMNITNLLGGEFPQLNQDGFTIGGEGDAGWAAHWDGSAIL